MSKHILLCTVGGSHEPILTSIRENKPAFVCFFCSGKDPVTGKPGSDVQVTGQGRVIKEHKDADMPTLPNIPTQAELKKEQYEHVIIPTDDPDESFKTISQHIQDLTERYPDAQLIADYTGGTKSMSVALALTAVENEAVDVRLVTGPRTSLQRVVPGTERMELINVETIRTQRDIEKFVGAWQYFAYAEAVTGLAGLKPRNRELQIKVTALQNLSGAFDAWDRFDHQQAADTVDLYRKQIALGPKHLLTSIRNLTAETPSQEPARLWDLWFNALRRAEQGRFDDAVARLYRLLEWTAQWLLRKYCKIETSNVPESDQPKGMSLKKNKKGQYQAGLMDAWRLVAHNLPDLPDGQAKEFGRTKLNGLQDQIELRNYSILAHGYTPIGQRDWQAFRTWMEDNFLNLLETETRQAGLRQIPQQLPQAVWPELENL